MRKKLEPRPGAICSPEDMHWLKDDGYFYELEDGVLVRYPASVRATMVRGHIIGELFSYCKPRRDAWIFSLGVAFQCFPRLPNTVRRPSVSYLTWDRISVEDSTKEEHCKVAPDLIAEVLIDGDLPGGVHRRIADWLESGVNVVWQIDPKMKSLIVHHRNGPMIPLSESDTLTCDELLPGFSCRVGDFFATPV